MAVYLCWVARGEDLTVGLGGRTGEGVSDETVAGLLRDMPGVGRVLPAGRDKRSQMRLFTVILAKQAHHNVEVAMGLLGALRTRFAQEPITIRNADFAHPKLCSLRQWAMMAVPR